MARLDPSLFAPPSRRRVRQILLTAALATGSCVAAPGSGAPRPAAPPAPAIAAPSAAPVASSSFRHVYTDEFDGTGLDGRWSTYTGQPSSDPFARFDAARVAVGGGAVTLGSAPVPGSPGRWTTGGISNWRNAQTYGRWTVRFRATTSSIQSYHFLLWPSANTWPPELDVAESWDVGRRRLDGFVHYRDGSGAERQAGASVSGSFTDWNTVSLTWTPGEVTYALNGVVFYRGTGEQVPSQPMWLALQTETQICDRARAACATDTTPGANVQVDSVTVEAYTG